MWKINQWISYSKDYQNTDKINKEFSENEQSLKT